MPDDGALPSRRGGLGEGSRPDLTTGAAAEQTSAGPHSSLGDARYSACSSLKGRACDGTTMERWRAGGGASIGSCTRGTQGGRPDATSHKAPHADTHLALHNPFVLYSLRHQRKRHTADHRGCNCKEGDTAHQRNQQRLETELSYAACSATQRVTGHSVSAGDVRKELGFSPQYCGLPRARVTPKAHPPPCSTDRRTPYNSRYFQEAPGAVGAKW